METVAQQTLDSKNNEFWNTLCGTRLAKSLGIEDNTPADLKKFDDWYMAYYPYLEDYIPFADVKNKKTLEMGLGYGTVAQKLMLAGADYHGLDISDGPVKMAQYRADLFGVDSKVQQGSALAIPYADNTFDYVVSIGCLHHTGNLALALTEVSRVLKPNGKAVLMMYNALSYRHWSADLKGAYNRFSKPQAQWDLAVEKMRKQYDSDTKDNAAPYTTFVSSQELTDFLKSKTKNLKIHTTNIGDEHFLRLFPRALKLKFLGPWLGLDHYIVFNKK